MNPHHLGYVVASIEKAVPKLRNALSPCGVSEIFYDPLQIVKVLFLYPKDSFSFLITADSSPSIVSLEKEVWPYPMTVIAGSDTYGVASSPAVDQGFVFFGGLDGKFYAIRTDD